MHALNHVGFFGLVAEQSARGLVLVNECQLAASRVQEDLVDHLVRPSRVHHGSVEDDEPKTDHDRQHDGVASVKGVFLDQKCQYRQRHHKP